MIRQVNPFEIGRAPRILKKKAFELWNAFKVIVTDDVFEQVFRPRGVGRMDVLLHKDKSPIKGISQLIINKRVDLQLGEYDKLMSCDVCGSVKYNSSPYFGFFKPSSDDFDVAESNQLFGGGRLGLRAVIISSVVYRELRALKVKGLILSPCRENWPQDLKIGVKQPNYPTI
jgi:hypothetical protein